MRVLILMITAGLAASGAAAQTSTQTPAPPRPTLRPLDVPLAPAFKAGEMVVDRNGAAIGQIKTLTESDLGPMVVVQIDGKLVSVLQSTLRIDGQRAISAQTKAQMLAAAGAPG